jgi:hypothetical protein
LKPTGLAEAAPMPMKGAIARAAAENIAKDLIESFMIVSLSLKVECEFLGWVSYFISRKNSSKSSRDFSTFSIISSYRNHLYLIDRSR